MLRRRRREWWVGEEEKVEGNVQTDGQINIRRRPWVHPSQFALSWFLRLDSIELIGLMVGNPVFH